MYGKVGISLPLAENEFVKGKPSYLAVSDVVLFYHILQGY